MNTAVDPAAKIQLCDIHVELADLNKEALELAAKIQINFEELGV